MTPINDDNTVTFASRTSVYSQRALAEIKGMNLETTDLFNTNQLTRNRIFRE